MTDNSAQIDLGGNDLIVNNLLVGATAPGQQGTTISPTEITYLDGVTAGTAAVSKAVVLSAGGSIATIVKATITTIASATITNTGAVSIGTTLTTSGAVSLGSTLNVAAGASLATTLNVAGAVSNASTMNTVGAITGSGAILSSSATGGIGYATGAGASIAQAGAITTAVTLNAPSGVITLVAGSIATAGAVSFALVNSNLATVDNIVVNATGSNLAAIACIQACVPVAGTGQIVLRNILGASIQGTGSIQYSIVKGALS